MQGLIEHELPKQRRDLSEGRAGLSISVSLGSAFLRTDDNAQRSGAGWALTEINCTPGGGSPAGRGDGTELQSRYGG
jgi:hypothetical protein